MKAKITFPNNLIIEAEGTPDEIRGVAMGPAVDQAQKPANPVEQRKKTFGELMKENEELVKKTYPAPAWTYR